MKRAIAIVGAGIAGLACARRLAAAGDRVTVFEKNRTAGGRVATLRTEVGGFDHGAQYFTVRDAAFADEVARWREAGVIAAWNPRIATLGASSAQDHRSSERHVGVPGMSAISTHLAKGLDIRFEARIVGLERVGVEGAAPRWAVKRLDYASDSDGLEVTEGLYEMVVVAVPAEQAVRLLASAPNLAMKAAGATLVPCWTLMLAFAETIALDRPLDYDAAFVHGSRLAWIAHEAGKPQRRAGERWVGEASAAWSIEHLDDDPEDVKAKLVRAFHDLTGRPAQPVYSAVHRWRYALAEAPLSCGFLWNAMLAIGACGDWCADARVEGAWLSGCALAETIDAAR